MVVVVVLMAVQVMVVVVVVEVVVEVEVVVVVEVVEVVTAAVTVAQTTVGTVVCGRKLFEVQTHLAGNVFEVGMVEDTVENVMSECPRTHHSASHLPEINLIATTTLKALE